MLISLIFIEKDFNGDTWLSLVRGVLFQFAEAVVVSFLLMLMLGFKVKTLVSSTTEKASLFIITVKAWSLIYTHSQVLFFQVLYLRSFTFVVFSWFWR